MGGGGGGGLQCGLQPRVAELFGSSKCFFLICHNRSSGCLLTDHTRFICLVWWGFFLLCVCFLFLGLWGGFLGGGGGSMFLLFCLFSLDLFSFLSF